MRLHSLPFLLRKKYHTQPTLFLRFLSLCVNIVNISFPAYESGPRASNGYKQRTKPTYWY